MILGLTHVSQFALQSLSIGTSVAAICTFVAVSWQLFVCHTSSDFVTFRSRQCAKRLALLTILAVGPPIAIHPVFLTVNIYNAKPPLSWILPANSDWAVDVSDWGIIFVGVLLYLPLAYFAAISLPMHRWINEAFNARCIGLSKTIVSYFLVLPKVLIGAISIFLFITILSQTMVFVPAMSGAKHSETIGRILYDSIFTGGIKATTAIQCGFWLATEAIIAATILLLLYCFRTNILNFCIGCGILFQNISQRIQWPKCLGVIQPSFKYLSCWPLLATFRWLPLVPILMIGVVMILLVLSMVTEALSLLFVDGLNSIIETLYNSTANASFNTAIGNSASFAIVCLIFALVATFVATFISGFLDRWQTSGLWHVTSRIAFTGTALVPPMIVGYVYCKLFYHWHFTTLSLLLAITSTALALACLHGYIHRTVYGFGYIQTVLTLDMRRFWQRAVKYILFRVTLVASFAALLAWNDVALQVFANTQIETMPTQIMAIKIDGLTDYQIVVFDILQVIVLLVSVPIVWMSVKRADLSREYDA